MKTIKRAGNILLLRFDRGEEVLEGLKTFCRSESIGAATLTALGAAQAVELAFYDLGAKEYLRKDFQETLEIAGMTGNVAQDGEEIIIHAHGVFSDRNMQPMAGHINKLVTAGTCELTLTILPGTVEREYSEATGLKLLK